MSAARDAAAMAPATAAVSYSRPRALRIAPVLGALVLAASLARCAGPRGPVRIGVVSRQAFGPAAELAASDIAAAAGARGRPIELLYDSVPGVQDDAEGAIRVARSVLRRPVVGVVGHPGSRSSLVAAPVYDERGVVELVPTGTSRVLARAGPWTFTLPPDDSVEGGFIAGFVRDRLQARSVVTFFVNDEYGIGLRDGVRAALAGTPVRLLREVRYDASSSLAVLVDAAVRAEVPDVVIVAGRAADPGRIAIRLAERGMHTAIVAGDGAYALPTLVDAAAGHAEGIYVVSFWLAPGGDSAAARFARDFQARWHREPVSRDAMAYDAVRLLATAVREVGDSPGAVRGYLAGLGTTRPRYRGVTGEIGFGAGAGPPRLVMGIVRDSLVVPAGGGR